MRIHEKCVIDGEDFYGVITTYHGFDRLRLSKPVSDSKRIYFEPGSQMFMIQVMVIMWLFNILEMLI